MSTLKKHNTAILGAAFLMATSAIISILSRSLSLVG